MSFVLVIVLAAGLASSFAMELVRQESTDAVDPLCIDSPVADVPHGRADPSSIYQEKADDV